MANCPGRFVCISPVSAIAPAALIGASAPVHEYRLAHVRDPVIVIPLDDGGLISYRRANGSYLHTLNTRAGFARKLDQLGLGNGS